MIVSIHKSIIKQLSFDRKSVRSVHVKGTGECLVASDVWRAIGYDRKAGVQAIQRLVPEKYKMRPGDLCVDLKNKQLHHNTVLLKEAGLRLFLTHCKKPEAVEFVRSLGINTENSLCMSKEQDTYSCMMKAFEVEEMKCPVSYTHLTLPTTPYV